MDRGRGNKGYMVQGSSLHYSCNIFLFFKLCQSKNEITDQVHTPNALEKAALPGERVLI